MITLFQVENFSIAAFDKTERTGSAEGKNSSDNGAESTHTFVSSLIVNLSVAVVVISLFSILRPRLKRIYSPRQMLLDMMFPLGKLPHSFFAWIIPAFMASDDDVFYYAGIDALVYMRFLKLCIKISVVIFPYGTAVLVPLHCFGKVGVQGLDKLAVSNVQPGSSRLWAHLIAAWIYTMIICYLLYEEWKIYIMYRQEYLSCGKGHQYTLLVRDVPLKVSIYGLLTNGQDSWILAKFFLRVSSRSVNTQKRTWPISSHLDQTSMVNKGFIIWDKTPKKMIFGPSRQYSSILPAQVANHSVGFCSFCRLTELVI